MASDPSLGQNAVPPEAPVAPTLSVIIPAYREEEYLEGTISDVVQCLRARRLSFEVIIVLDVTPGDRTVDVARVASARFPEVTTIERQGKRGVGDAVREGIRASRGEVVVPMMADHSESGDDLVRLVDVSRRGYDLTVAERFGHGVPPGYPPSKYFANRLLNLSARLLLMLPMSDTTNAFKAYRRESLAAITLRSKGFEIFLELPVKAACRPGSRVARVETGHIARKGKEAKLSLSRDGPRYARTLFLLIASRGRAYR